MAQFRALRSRHLQRLLNPQNPSQYRKNPLRIRSNTTHCRPKLESSNSDTTHDPDSKPKKPLHVLFKEAVGLSEVTDRGHVDNEVEASELSRKLRKLEEEVRKLKEKSCEGETQQKLVKKSSDDESDLKDLRANNKSLYTVFASNGGGEKNEDMANVGMEDPRAYKELSREMGEFVTHLFEKGYLRGANFLPRDKFDINCFENSYARDFVKYVSEKFGKDNQEIAKWLSASDLKKVASLGCPSMGRKDILSAKRLRKFFDIPEDTVCRKCILKSSCRFVNQGMWKGDKNLDLAVAMRVITLYALESIHPKLVMPDEIKESVNRLLKEVVNLSQTIA